MPQKDLQEKMERLSQQHQMKIDALRREFNSLGNSKRNNSGL